MKNKMDKKYNHILIEELQKNNIFKKETQYSKNNIFKMILPPPNVTGKLHLGHAWDTILADIIIRYNDNQGIYSEWIPGMDHAGIATQVKATKALWEEHQQTIDEIGKEAFLKYTNKYINQNANIIRNQWKQLGLNLDYDKEKFTLDQDVSQIVKETFVNLYKQKLIYQKYKMVHWDVSLKTAISNIEINYKEELGKMHYVKYFIADQDDFLIVATTRPETMFADQCLIVNPNDKRYTKYINKKAINPSNGEKIPIISDEYVDVKFGTGVMKCTPAHDFNDYELGLKHNLKNIQCIDYNGHIINAPKEYINLERYEARKLLIHNLKTKNLLDKIEDHKFVLAYSDRTNIIIEPMLSKQWYLNVQKISQNIIELQNSNNKIEFLPERFNNTLIKWLENIEDWCISRQLWWGHEIPIWYHKDTKEIYCETKPPVNQDDYIKDKDVLDTWFSSGLWPFICQKDNCPNLIDVLVTGYDIIFFWVARMAIQTFYKTDQKPFEKVLIHGLIRDEQGRKMSKSLNNGIDPKDVIKEYGADSLRLFLIANTTPGNDLTFSYEKLRSNWNFINKLWNSCRYILLSLPMNFNYNFEETKEIIFQDHDYLNKDIIYKLKKVKKDYKKQMDKFEFGLAYQKLYNFIWNDFCANYIELSKSNIKNNINIENTYKTLYYCSIEFLIMLNPFIPFVTSYLLKEFNVNNKKTHFIEINSNNKINEILKIIKEIREWRTENNISKKNALKLISPDINLDYIDIFKLYLKDIINVDLLKENINNEKEYYHLKNAKIDYYIYLNNHNQSNEILNKLNKQKEILEKEVERSNKILNNLNFLAKAKPEKVQSEERKQKEYKEKLKKIIFDISKLK